ncbi:hypothetical protein FRC20_006477 [Serendipita sp. 405]|nr:hypothetical protein FRC15_007519 [Serendipita sp. 397]KAG8770845.1 hypothetical protein FRC16_006202 [Serendipita sp. 398]KAG8838187.1 hypothetical protein FRC20_006477 [Serendipita sp. 405]
MHAVEDAFTAENILCAWQKTGLCPVSRAAISNTDLAPSRAFSTTQALPLPPPSPVRVVVEALYHQNCLHNAMPPKSPTTTPIAIMPLMLALFSPITLPCDCSCSEASVECLCNDFNAFDLEEHDGSMLPLPTREALATDIACNILQGLKTTSMAPIIDFESLTSACGPPALELGPLPTKLANWLKRHTEIPNEAEWEIFRNEFIHLVARADCQLAINVLQHIACQQFQCKLSHKEHAKERQGLHKIPGYKNGVIYTDQEVWDILAKIQAQRESQKGEADRKRAEKALKEEAQKWLDAALEVQEEEHARQIAKWKAIPVWERPTRRQPGKPPLPEMPEHYKNALNKKASGRKPRARAATPDDEDSFVDNYDD